MANTFDKLKTLKKRLNECQVSFQILKSNLENSKSQNRQEIRTKEKELEDWREKLETCQQERNQIKQEIRENRIELEKSELSNAEKQEKINKLLTENSEELEELDNLLYSERAQYRSIRDNLIKKLLVDCSLCQEKERLVNNLETQVSHLKVLVVLGIIVSSFGFALFLYSNCKRERERERAKMKKTLINALV